MERKSSLLIRKVCLHGQGGSLYDWFKGMQNLRSYLYDACNRVTFGLALSCPAEERNWHVEVKAANDLKDNKVLGISFQ